MEDEDTAQAESEKAMVFASTKVKTERHEVKPRTIPPPGTGQKIYEVDPSLQGHRQHLDFR